MVTTEKVGWTRWRVAIALVSVIAVSIGMGGCISKSAAPEVQVVSVPIGSSTQTIVVDGLRRTFHVYRPGSLPSAARSPLVVFLHGGFGSGSQAERSYGWDAEAARGQFLVVYPDGTNHAWNAGGGCCGKPAESNVDDVAFISKMVALLEREVPIDPDAVYATGISNGGIMSYRLACDDHDLRRHRSRLGHDARRLPLAVTDLGHPHPQDC